MIHIVCGKFIFKPLPEKNCFIILELKLIQLAIPQIFFYRKPTINLYMVTTAVTSSIQFRLFYRYLSLFHSRAEFPQNRIQQKLRLEVCRRFLQ